MPAAIGAALTRTPRPIVCILGEGSAQYCIQALYSAVMYGAKVTFIVLNNGEYAILKSFGMFLGTKGAPGLDIPNINFEGLCNGYGIEYASIKNQEEITDVVRCALNAQGSTLIDIPIDKTVHTLIG
jgi:benzoylformate decarboxylase